MFRVCSLVVMTARFPSTLKVFKPPIAAEVASLTTNVTDVPTTTPATTIDAVTVTGPGVGPSVSVIWARPPTVAVEVLDGIAPPVTVQVTVTEGSAGVTLTTSGLGSGALMTPV